MFILPFDFDMTIRRDILAIVNQGNARAQQDAEETAVEMVRSYLKERYDCDQIFVNVHGFTQSATYSAGEIVYYNNGDNYAVYVCTNSSVGNLPSNSSFFEMRDPRSKLIVMYCCDIALYCLFSSAAPQKLSDLRMKRFDDAVLWLKRVSKGEISPVLPAYTNPASSSDDVRWGSNQKMGHNY
jgi:hypothetical protein